VAEAALDPSNGCKSCQASVSTGAYSPRAKDTTCTPTDPFTIFPTCDGAGVCGTPYCSVRDCWAVTSTNQTECAIDGAISACPGQAGGSACGTTTGCGQDAQYPDAAPRAFTTAKVGADEVVTDSSTGLMWQGTDGACGGTGVTTCPQSNAEIFCINLSYGGYTDWRLPTINELLNLLQPGDLSPGTGFPGGLPTLWSVTRYQPDGNKAWLMTYDYFGNAPVFALSQAEGARCVRGKTRTLNAAERYLVTPVGSQKRVLDRSTGLEWQYSGVPETTGKTWNQALAYCESLSYAGKTDWRLPNLHESYTLLDFSHHAPATTLPGGTSEHFWTSSHAVAISGSAPGLAYSVGFKGDEADPPTSGFATSAGTAQAVRCVR
jgi:hypothetical protein